MHRWWSLTFVKKLRFKQHVLASVRQEDGRRCRLVPVWDVHAMTTYICTAKCPSKGTCVYANQGMRGVRAGGGRGGGGDQFLRLYGYLLSVRKCVRGYFIVHGIASSYTRLFAPCRLSSMLFGSLSAAVIQEMRYHPTGMGSCLPPCNCGICSIFLN